MGESKYYLNKLKIKSINQLKNMSGKKDFILAIDYLDINQKQSLSTYLYGYLLMRGFHRYLVSIPKVHVVVRNILLFISIVINWRYENYQSCLK